VEIPKVIKDDDLKIEFLGSRIAWKTETLQKGVLNRTSLLSLAGFYGECMANVSGAFISRHDGSALTLG
jgi:hypothetical protein